MTQSDFNVEAAYKRIDRAYQSYLEQHSEVSEQWLLVQALYGALERRALYGFLPIADGMRVLDVGTGFGTLAIELAAFKELRIHAMDLNRETLRVAEEIYTQVAADGALRDGSSVAFEASDLYNLPYPDETFDWIVARYVYQHLGDPQEATAQLARVVKPGGYVCLIDVDDQLNLTYPEPAQSFQRLQQAFEAVQAKNGGDRFIGRKLAGFLHDAGLQVVSTWVQPQAQFIRSEEYDPGLQLTLLRLREMKQQIVDQNIMNEDEFEACLRSFQSGVTQWQFHAAGQIVVVAKR